MAGKLLGVFYMVNLEAFIGPRPLRHVAHHKDTHTKNNRKINLEWVTPSKNVKHAYEIGNLNQRGSKNNGSILNENQVVLIRKILKRTNLTHKKIGRIFGVARSTISQINTGLNWSHLGG